jgi:hypothetical protein
MRPITQPKFLNGFNLLPAKDGTCETCATQHDPVQPHNAQSLFYQYRFYGDNGRWPNWKDAMQHCSDDIKDQWLTHLSNMGVDVESGQITPREKQ